MADTEIDKFPVSELQNRYDIGRTALYERLNTIGIKPIKIGAKAFISGLELQSLDNLHLHLQRGGGYADFEQDNKLFGESGEQSEQDNKLLKNENRNYTILDPEALNLIADMIENVVRRLMPGINRLQYLEQLEKAAEKGWLLSTREVADLLKLNPNTEQYICWKYE